VQTIKCSRCGSTDIVLQWQQFANGTRHIRATCANPACRHFLQFVPQEEEAIKRADTTGAWTDEKPKRPPPAERPRQLLLFGGDDAEDAQS
jgi:hypothetical protein